MPRPDVPAGSVVVFTDVMCGWSTLALHRFYAAREKAGLEDEVDVDLQLFLLEDVNQTALDFRTIEGEKPVVGALAEELDFKPWQRDPSEYPVTSLLANEAVHAAKLQSVRAAEELDMALRIAFARDSCCISMRHEVLDVARACDQVDADQLESTLDEGTARGPMLDMYRAHREDVQGSPHFFFADGGDVHNPGIRMHQVSSSGAGFLVVDHDDPGVYASLVERARSTPANFSTSL